MMTDQGVFVISLDAVDLNLLPINYMSRHDKIAPLWTKCSLNTKNDEYYEFKIGTSESVKSSKDALPNLKFENEPCYICNIEVPKPFVSEHSKSLKHKTNMKIATIAVHRIIKYLNNIHEHDDYKADQYVYFCPSCITVVDMKDKHTHMKSILHKNSMAVDKILKDFLVLFEGDHNYDDENNHTDPHSRLLSDDSGVIEHKTSNLNDSELHNLLQKSINASVKNNGHLSNELMQAIKNPLDKKPKNVENTTDTIFLHDYINLINDCCSKSRMYLKAVEHDVLEIEVVDGSIVVITDTHFYGFNEIGKKHYQCLVCKELFKKKQTEKHMLSENHRKKMCLPLKDKHCIRQVADNWYHCVICNNIVECPDIHILCNKDHNYRLKHVLVSDKLDDSAWLENRNDCSQVKERLKSEHHEAMNVVLNKEQKSGTKQKEEQIEISNVHLSKPFVKDTKIFLSGDNCPKNFVDETYSYKKSISEAQEILTSGAEVQREAIDNITTKADFKNDGNKCETLDAIETKIQPLDVLCQSNLGNKYFCTSCNIHISIHRHARHTKSLKHILNSSSEYHYLMEQISNNVLFCKVCGDQCPNKANIVKQHALHKDHIIKYNNLLEYNRVYRINESKLYCELCKLCIWNKNEIIHVKDRKHLLFLQEIDKNTILPQKRNKDDNDTMILENVKDHFKQKLIIQPHMTFNINDNHTDHEPYSIDDQSNKADGILHKINDKNIDPLTCDDSNNEVCRKLDTISVAHDINIDNNNKLLTECYSSDHVSDNLALQPHYCNICEVKVPNREQNIQEHVKGKSHINNLSKLFGTMPIKSNEAKVEADGAHYLMAKTEFANLLSCTVCSLFIINNENNISLHVNDANHVKNYDQFLRDNHLIQTLDNIHCEICEIDICFKSEVIHVKGRKHIKKINAKKASTLANIVTTQSNMAILKADVNDDADVKLVGIPVIDKEVINLPSTSNKGRETVKNQAIKPEMLLLLASTDNDKEVMCKICKVIIPSTEYNIRTHINGAKHIKAHISLLSEE